MITDRTIRPADEGVAAPPGDGGASAVVAKSGERTLHGWQPAVLFGIGFLVLAEASTFLSVPDRTYVSFWLPAGLYISVLLLAERRIWPALVLGAAAGNLAFDLVHGTPFFAALLFVLTNAVQSVSGASLVHRLVASRPTLTTLREYVAFLAFGAVLSPAVAAVIGAGTLVAFGFSDSFAQSWRVWWGSNAISILVLSPFILTACTMTRADTRRFAGPKQLVEAALLTVALLAVTSYFLFRLHGVMSPGKGWVAYIVIWAGLRFGALGAGTATLLLSVVVAFFTTQLHSGLTPEQIASGEYVFVMQTALVALALLAWIPAVVVGERDRKMLELAESEWRLKLANAASNIGLWDWDIAGRRVYYSPESKRQLGYRDDEIASRLGEWDERLHPDDARRARARLKACLNDPRLEYESEFRLRHRDGSYRWMYARAEILRDAEGRPVRVLGCHADITERKRAEGELRRSLSRQRELSRRLLEVETEERRNISRELHDRVGQNLAALGLDLEMVRGRLPQDSLRAVEARLNDARNLLEATSRHVRDVMAELRPAALDDYGLVAALRNHAEEFAKRHGVAVTVREDGSVARLALAVETEMFRIAQEALHNTAKHARAGRVDVVLSEANGRVTLSIADDGTGFDPAQPRQGAQSWGMTTMRERAESVGARLEVESSPGKGTRVIVEVDRVRS